VQAGEWEWISSEVLELEIEQSTDPQRSQHLHRLLHHVDRSVAIMPAEAQRMRELERLGFRALDALHIACAESEG
jgi:hypothetical protein